jgi:hypothetical protein
MFGCPTTIDGSTDEPMPALLTAAMEMVYVLPLLNRMFSVIPASSNVSIFEMVQDLELKEQVEVVAAVAFVLPSARVTEDVFTTYVVELLPSETEML